MKKTILILSILFCISIQGFSQMFYKKCMFSQIGSGIGIQHFTYTDVTNNQTNPLDTSAAVEIPFNFEYAVTNWLGGSLDGNFAKYLTGDSAKNSSEWALDFVPTINVHAPFKLDHLDLSANLGYGYSHFSYKVTDNVSGGKATANGWVFNWGINLRVLFKKDGAFGMNFWYKHSLYNYNKGVISYTSGPTNDFKLDGTSNNFGLGFFYRIPGL